MNRHLLAELAHLFEVEAHAVADGGDYAEGDRLFAISDELLYLCDGALRSWLPWVS
jgi:hypothetical protein